jgi:integrase
VRWPSNGLRHSFASYRLAATNNAALTAAELGHINAQLLYSAYRELVRPEEAQRYWLISPPTEAGVVAFQTDV